jgi:hypothetical protein
MLSQEEREEIRQAVYTEMVDVEHRIEHDAGSYPFMVLLDGNPTFAHTACGPVIRYIPPRFLDCGLGF